MSYSIFSNLKLLFNSLIKSVGVTAAILLTINLAAYIAGVVSSSLSAESSKLFQQSAFSMEGMSLADQTNIVGIIGLFVLAFVAVFIRELKMQRSEGTSASEARMASVKDIKKTHARVSEKAA